MSEMIISESLFLYWMVVSYCLGLITIGLIYKYKKKLEDEE